MNNLTQTQWLALIDLLLNWAQTIDSSPDDIPKIEIPSQLSETLPAPFIEALSMIVESLHLHHRRQLLQQTQKSESITLLGNVAAAIASLAPLSEVLQRICESTRHLLRSDIGYIALLTEEEDCIIVQAGAGVSPALIGVRQRLGHGIGGRVVVNRRPTIFVDYRREVRRDPDVETAIDREGIVSAVATPMIFGRRVIGVLYTAMRTPRRYTPQEVELATNLASLAAVAISNASLYEQTSWLMTINREFADAIVHDNVLDQVCSTLDRLTDAEVIVVDQSHRQVNSPRLNPLELNEDIHEIFDSTLQANSHDDHVFVTKQKMSAMLCHITREHAGPAYLLVIKRIQDTPFTQRERMAIERAKALLAVGLTQAQLQEALNISAASTFLHHLITGKFRRFPSSLDKGGHQLNPYQPHRLLVASGEGFATSPRLLDESGLIRAVQTHLDNPPFLASTLEKNFLTVLIPDNEACHHDWAVQLHSYLSKLSPAQQVWIAISARVVRPDDYPLAWKNAIMALQWHVQLNPTQFLVDTNQYGLIGVLFDASHVDQIRAFCMSTLGALANHDQQYGGELIHTLTVYLDNECELRQSASALHIHYNTLRYRIHQIENTLKVNLADVGTRQQLRLALWCNTAFKFL